MTTTFILAIALAVLLSLAVGFFFGAVAGCGYEQKRLGRTEIQTKQRIQVMVER